MLKNILFVFILSVPFIVLGWYLLSLIHLGLYRIVDRSFYLEPKHKQEYNPYFVLEYLSPVGWQETVGGSIPGDGWTYTVQWPTSFKSLKQAKAFCKKHNKKLTTPNHGNKYS